MEKILFLFTILFTALPSYLMLAQTPIDETCQKLANSAYANIFNLDSIEHSKAALLKSIKTASEEKIKNCNCNDSLFILSMRDRRNFGPMEWTHQRIIPDVLDTNRYLLILPQEIDYAVLQREFSFLALSKPIDTIKQVLSILNEMAMEPNELGVRHYNGCVGGEILMIRNHREALVEEYFEMAKDESVETHLKDMLLVNLFSPKITNPKMDSLSADIIQPDHPLFYRMCGLLRIYGGPWSTDKIMHMAATMDSTQKEFTLSLPVSYYQKEQISKKKMREYASFIFKNELYPWCEKGGLQYLGEKNETAFKRRYRKYLK